MEEISVLIPCYNSGKTIRDCINSVLSQTYPKHNIKIIVANDGSTDNTLEILQNCQMTVGSDNFFIINQENKGISETRNVLIKHVKTKWFIFLDSDDRYTKKAFAQMFDTIKNNEDVDLICSKNSWYLHGTFKRGIFANFFKKNTKLEQYIVNADYGYVWNKIYRTDFIVNNKIKFLSGNLSEDLYWSTLILDKKPKIAFCTHHTYFYTKGKKNVSFTLTAKKCEMYVDMLKHIIENTNNKLLSTWLYVNMLLWCSTKIKTDDEIKNIVSQLNKLVVDKSFNYKVSLWKKICYKHVKKYFSI